MNLYELSEQYQDLLSLMQSVDTTDPQYFEAYQDTMEAINDAFDSKAEGYAMIINQLSADIDAVKNEMNRLADKKRAYERNIDRLKETLKAEMEATGKERIKTPLFNISVRNNAPSLFVSDETLIPQDFFIPQPSRLDKNMLKDAIKHGYECEGAHLITKRSLQIR